MKTKYVIGVVVVLGSALSCIHREEHQDTLQVQFEAVHADAPLTKTVLQADGSVFWSQGDAINLFFGESGSTILKSSGGEAVAQTTFTGTLDGFLPNGKDAFWAVYPYSAANTFDGSAVTLSLPDTQTGIAGTFANNLFISLARSQDYTLQFYNLCGGVKFSVAGEGITRVTFKGNNGEVLAGRVQAAFDDNGRPQVVKLLGGATQLVLDAPEGGFEAGKWYYMVALPTALSAGYTMDFYDASGKVVSERVTDTPITIKRSVWGRLTEADVTENNFIYYTSTDGKIVEPNEGASFGEGVSIVSNTYEDGQGVIQFDGPVTTVGKDAFKTSYFGTGRLTSVELPESCLSVEKEAFQYQSLEEVRLPGRLQLIGQMAFYGCKPLKMIEFPESLNRIENYAFCSCELLEEVTIPQSVEYLGGGVFADCTGLKQFFGRYAADSGRALINGQTLLAVAPEGLSSYVIPDAIQMIGAGVFSGFSNLTEIVLPEGLVSIGSQAFSDCGGLVEMIIPDSVKEVDSGVFRRCRSLERIQLSSQLTILPSEFFSGCVSLPEIQIPEGVKSIGQIAFSGCSALHTLTVPAGVKTVGLNAFRGCTGLESIVFEPVTPPTGANGMLDNTNDCPIYVPEQSVDAYKSAEYWSDYASRIQAGGGENAFSASKYLSFTSQGTTKIALKNVGGNLPVLYYSQDADLWTKWNYDTLTVSSGKPLYLCGDNPDGFSKGNSSYSRFVATGDSFAVSGDIMSLLDKDKDLLTIPSQSCFYGLFAQCGILTSAPSLPATELTWYCYSRMFYKCTGLTAAPDLPATTMENACYEAMFYGCTSLTSVPQVLPARDLAVLCYHFMFWGCTSLVTAPALPATTLTEDCYNCMFYGCSSLTATPDLPATTLAPYCYYAMFSGGCTSLASAPSVLPAETLAESCYQFMFWNCTSLTQAPELPATTLAPRCYYSMFEKCSGLVTAPVLPATSLAEDCYRFMFWNCTSLTQAPELPATTLKKGCYYNMFGACEELTTAPDLPAAALADSCYYIMFADSPKLQYVRCLATDISANGCVGGWLSGVASEGVFVQAANMQWPSGDNGIPEGWTAKNDGPLSVADVYDLPDGMTVNLDNVLVYATGVRSFVIGDSEGGSFLNVYLGEVSSVPVQKGDLISLSATKNSYCGVGQLIQPQELKTSSSGNNLPELTYVGFGSILANKPKQVTPVATTGMVFQRSNAAYTFNYLLWMNDLAEIMHPPVYLYWPDAQYTNLNDHYISARGFWLFRDENSEGSNDSLNNFLLFQAEEWNPPYSEASVQDVLSGTDDVSYKVTGTVTQIVNTSYGNLYITDNSTQETLYIYGLLGLSGAYPKDSSGGWESFNISENSVITVIGKRTTYNNLVELVDATLLRVSNP